MLLLLPLFPFRNIATTTGGRTAETRNGRKREEAIITEAAKTVTIDIATSGKKSTGIAIIMTITATPIETMIGIEAEGGTTIATLVVTTTATTATTAGLVGTIMVIVIIVIVVAAVTTVVMTRVVENEETAAKACASPARMALALVLLRMALTLRFPPLPLRAAAAALVTAASEEKKKLSGQQKGEAAAVAGGALAPATSTWLLRQVRRVEPRTAAAFIAPLRPP